MSFKPNKKIIYLQDFFSLVFSYSTFVTFTNHALHSFLIGVVATYIISALLFYGTLHYLTKHGNLTKRPRYAWIQLACYAMTIGSLFFIYRAWI